MKKRGEVVLIFGSGLGYVILGTGLGLGYFRYSAIDLGIVTQQGLDIGKKSAPLKFQSTMHFCFSKNLCTFFLNV